MPQWLNLITRVLQIVFAIGVAGCFITIPIVAVKFASVLFEKSNEEEENSGGGSNVEAV